MWSSIPATGVELTPELLLRKIASLPRIVPEPPRGFRPAAVLVPFFFLPKPHLLFLKRPETMREHPGQVAFPGGKQEEGETPGETALRETEEELGIAPQRIELVGQIPPVPSLVTRFWITPVVGILKGEDTRIAANPEEVEEWFLIPFEELLHPPRHHWEEILVEGERERVDYLYFPAPGGERLIWGATARVLRSLLEHLFT